ncbi:MAG: hypothetical protein ABIE94_00725 [archaeon]
MKFSKQEKKSKFLDVYLKITFFYILAGTIYYLIVYSIDIPMPPIWAFWLIRGTLFFASLGYFILSIYAIVHFKRRKFSKKMYVLPVLEVAETILVSIVSVIMFFVVPDFSIQISYSIFVEGTITAVFAIVFSAFLLIKLEEGKK